jgi:hypothetical protein
MIATKATKLLWPSTACMFQRNFTYFLHVCLPQILFSVPHGLARTKLHWGFAKLICTISIVDKRN